MNRLALPFVLVVLLLLTTIPAIISYQKGKALYFTMSIRTSAPGLAALYYDLGSGFREADKAVMQIRQDPSALVYAFSIPNRDLLRFRFDPPATFEGTISIGNIRIVNARGKTLREIDANLLKPLHQIRTFQHAGSEVILTIQDGADDPQVSINLDSPFRPTWSILKDWLFLGLIAGEILLIILIYFMILYLWPRWRVHPKRKAILVAFLFLYAGGLWVISAKATTTYLKINMQSSFSGVAQLFYDTGSGYSEASSVRVNIAGGSDFSGYLFRLPDNKISQFRFDPLSSAGRFVIRQMEVVSGLGVSIHSLALNQVQPGYQIREDKMLDQDLHIVTEEQADDPQLIVTLQRPLHLRKMDLLLNPVSHVCALSLFSIILLSMAGIAWGWQCMKIYKDRRFPERKMNVAQSIEEGIVIGKRTILILIVVYLLLYLLWFFASYPLTAGPFWHDFSSFLFMAHNPLHGMGAPYMDSLYRDSLNFNTYQFYIFFVFVYLLFLCFRDHNKQNLFLIIASCIFYISFSTRYFLVILFASSLLDYYLSLKIVANNDQNWRKAYLIISISVNLVILGFFKYNNFFIENVADILRLFGFQPHISTLHILLPVSISFDTFQKIGYVTDVHNGSAKPAKNFLNYFLFICFFPRLVAGPIEVASHLIPQLERNRKICRSDVFTGLHWIIVGCFMKVAFADTVAPLVNKAFDNPFDVTGVSTLFAFLGFAIQIFGDFAGYTLIARGTAKMMGIELLENFRAPYIAVTPQDFWNRWHISLSVWLRKYLYIPLGGNRHGQKRQYGNILLTMALAGLWHGAKWNFVFWGLYHGLLLCVTHALLLKNNARPSTAFSKSVSVFVTFIAVCFGWILFRSSDLSFFYAVMNNVLYNFHWDAESTLFLKVIGINSVGVAIYHWIVEKYGDDTALLAMSPAVKVFTYTFMVVTINAIGFGGMPFIYFQF